MLFVKRTAVVRVFRNFWDYTTEIPKEAVVIEEDRFGSLLCKV
jgi:hypothetical protein